MPTPIRGDRRGGRDSQRTTRWGMVVIGLIVWLLGIAMAAIASEWTMPGILLGAVMVAWATFGLLTEP